MTTTTSDVLAEITEVREAIATKRAAIGKDLARLDAIAQRVDDIENGVTNER